MIRVTEIGGTVIINPIHSYGYEGSKFLDIWKTLKVKAR